MKITNANLHSRVKIKTQAVQEKLDKFLNNSARGKKKNCKKSISRNEMCKESKLLFAIADAIGTAF